ncbi:MAG TPA: hypothetical protein VMA74_09625 [Dyella sp.]|uniref:hypothetical protein n=1 Tax=Dyella sp. TaxID=1869338 RepID=UPI002C60FB34|nr:hypothetical protein [Dyella sp.]HUB89973.1 hypothetical protein [Dyella sp.]
MHRAFLSLGLIALCGLVSACGDHSDDRNITVINSNVLGLSHGRLHLSNGDVTVRTDDAPDAVISASGDLQIDQHPVAIDDAQRSLLKAYYNSAMLILTDGLATGKAGAALGRQVAKSVLTQLASGNPGKIQQDIDAKTKPLKEAALKICTDLGGVKNSQDQLAASLPAFKPYADVVSSDDVEGCRKNKND